MLYAALARCPVFGGKVASFDATKAKAVPGVKNVVQISNGVAVVADNTWAAMQGRKALEIQWDEGANARQSSAAISQTVRRAGAAARRGREEAWAMRTGACRRGQEAGAVYEAPYLSHAPMEPLNCTAVVRADSCDVWASTQMQSGRAMRRPQVTGLEAGERQGQHAVHGRRLRTARRDVDYVGEAVEIAKAMPGVPVKLTWSREDDMQHDFYRPASYVKFAGALDAEGWPLAFTARIACPSFCGGRGGNGVDGTAVEGIHNTGVPDSRTCWWIITRADAGIPTSYWRAVGYSQNTFFAESFLDEMAAAGGKDPVELRQPPAGQFAAAAGRARTSPRKRPAGASRPPGRFQGVAVVNNIGSFTAQVAEVSVTQGQAEGPSRGVRGRLRTRGQPGDHPAADRERHCFRTFGGAEGRDHHRQRPRAAGQLRYIRRAAHR